MDSTFNTIQVMLYEMEEMELSLDLFNCVFIHILKEKKNNIKNLDIELAFEGKRQWDVIDTSAQRMDKKKINCDEMYNYW